jgi:hypothetical protein
MGAGGGDGGRWAWPPGATTPWDTQRVGLCTCNTRGGTHMSCPGPRPVSRAGVRGRGHEDSVQKCSTRDLFPPPHPPPPPHHRNMHNATTEASHCTSHHYNLPHRSTNDSPTQYSFRPSQVEWSKSQGRPELEQMVPASEHKEGLQSELHGRGGGAGGGGSRVTDEQHAVSCTVCVGRHVPKVGGGERGHEGALARQCPRVALQLRKQGCVALVVTAQQTVGVVDLRWLMGRWGAWVPRSQERGPGGGGHNNHDMHNAPALDRRGLQSESQSGKGALTLVPCTAYQAIMPAGFVAVSNRSTVML